MMQDGVQIMIGSAAIVNVEDEALRKAIYEKLKLVKNWPPKVSYDAGEREFVLVFDESGAIRIGAGARAEEVAGMVANGGRFFVYATNPEPPPPPPPSEDPVFDNPAPAIPPPDTMCPCGGP